MKYARQCTATNIGMNSGWVIDDGEEYYSTEELAFKRCKELGYETIDEGLIDDVCYWTEWEDESEYQYTEVNGKLIEIQ